MWNGQACVLLRQEKMYSTRLSYALNVHHGRNSANLNTPL